MCRLLSYVAREPVVVSDMLQDIFTAFMDLSHFHNDGWGFAWYDEYDRIQLLKEPGPAYMSAQFSYRAGHIRTDAFLGHLRWATSGTICMENTHPFIAGQLAFAHNGSVNHQEELEELIAPHLRENLVGTTDSERHFLALLSALESAAPVEAIRTHMGHLHERLSLVNANFVLLTPDTLYVVCDFDPESRRAQKSPDYFPIKYCVTPDAVLVGSTGLNQDACWKTLENGQMLLVKRGTLDMTLVDLAYSVSDPIPF